MSPRNYLTFTSLLSSVECGIVAPSSNVRNKNEDADYLGVECLKIDAQNEKINCLSNNLNEKEETILVYHYLVVGIGACANTFSIYGVAENCCYLRGIEDVDKIIGCLERGSQPNLSEEERKQILHIYDDLVKLYPKDKNAVEITFLEAIDHIMNKFDKRIIAFVEEKFQRVRIDVKTGEMVVGVSDKKISTKEVKNGGIVVGNNIDEIVLFESHDVPLEIYASPTVSKIFPLNYIRPSDGWTKLNWELYVGVEEIACVYLLALRICEQSTGNLDEFCKLYLALHLENKVVFKEEGNDTTQPKYIMQLGQHRNKHI